jgi:hypothetical protein
MFRLRVRSRTSFTCPDSAGFLQVRRTPTRWDLIRVLQFCYQFSRCQAQKAVCQIGTGDCVPTLLVLECCRDRQALCASCFRRVSRCPFCRDQTTYAAQRRVLFGDVPLGGGDMKEEVKQVVVRTNDPIVAALQAQAALRCHQCQCLQDPIGSFAGGWCVQCLARINHGSREQRASYRAAQVSVNVPIRRQFKRCLSEGYTDFWGGRRRFLCCTPLRGLSEPAFRLFCFLHLDFVICRPSMNSRPRCVRSCRVVPSEATIPSSPHSRLSIALPRAPRA